MPNADRHQSVHPRILHSRALRSDPRQRLRQQGASRSNLSSGEEIEDGDAHAQINAYAIEVQADASTYGGTRDPPGQSSAYILSGCPESEQYRIATFAQFPLHVPIYPIHLAINGFYYTGFKDRVKCFSCGLAVENWMVGDDASDPKWHKSDCVLVNGRDTRNIPSPASARIRLLNQLTKPSISKGYTNYYGTCSSQVQTTSTSRGGISAIDTCTSRRSENEEGESGEPFLTVLHLAQIFLPEHEEQLLEYNLLLESDRRKTFRNWPTHPASQLPRKLAKEGFFYLGNLDRVQCFSCSGVLRNWDPSDCPREQHLRHFPSCRIVRGLERRNIPMSRDERDRFDQEEKDLIRQPQPLMEPPNPSEEEQQFLELYFPCRNAANPHMRSEEARFESFDTKWPNTTRATPRMISRAGFFFLGENDKAKCWYCNGGLQNWEVDDEPWTEHAKWFPGCEWLLRTKGVDFVRRIVKNYPTLKRPMLRNPTSYNIPTMPAAPRPRGVVAGPAAVPIGVDSPGTSAAENQSREASPADVNAGQCADSKLGKLQESQVCKKCRAKEANHIYIPCAHLACCSSCAAASVNCVVCGLKVDSIMRIYRA